MKEESVIETIEKLVVADCGIEEPFVSRRKAFGDCFVSSFVLVVRSPAAVSCSSLSLLNIWLIKPRLTPEGGEERSCVDFTYFRPTIVVIEIAVEHVVDYLYRIITLARKTGLKFLEFVGYT